MFRLGKGLPLLFLLLSVMLVAAGCGTNGAENKTEPAAQETGGHAAGADMTATAATDEKNGETRTVGHAMGKTEIQGSPQKIVTLFQGATDVAVAMGIKPVGIVESWVEQPIYQYLRNDLDGVPIVGLETQPNLEEIAKLEPDLIIGSKLRHEAIYEQLSEIAPTVMLETVYQFKETVKMMGQAMNQEDKAQKLLEDWDRRVADFKTKIGQKAGVEWPQEVAVLNFRADHARIYVSGFAPDILAELGYVFPEYQQQEREKGQVVIRLTSKESIPSMNADLFYIFKFDDSGDGAVQKLYEEWTGHPLWKNLDAVKNNKVYMVNEVFWNNGGGIIAANRMLDEIYEHFGLEK